MSRPECIYRFNIKVTHAHDFYVDRGPEWYHFQKKNAERGGGVQKKLLF